MPEIVCHECMKKGRLRKDHSTLHHRTILWHIIILSMLGIIIGLAYYKQILASMILLGYTYFTIIQTTKGAHK